MTKISSTLRIKTNIILIIIWGIIAGFLTYINFPKSLPYAFMGTVFGVIGGVMQFKGLRAGIDNITIAVTMIDVRVKFKETMWGKRYFTFHWISAIVMLTSAIMYYKVNPIIPFLTAYVCFMLLRELITLSAIIEISKKV